MMNSLVKNRGGKEKERSMWEEEEGEAESGVKNAKTLAWVEKRENREDGCMMMKGRMQSMKRT